MNKQQMYSQALALSESATAFAVTKWLNEWKSVGPIHPQYSMKEEQICIGQMALEIQRQH